MHTLHENGAITIDGWHRVTDDDLVFNCFKHPSFEMQLMVVVQNLLPNAPWQALLWCLEVDDHELIRGHGECNDPKDSTPTQLLGFDAWLANAVND